MCQIKKNELQTVSKTFIYIQSLDMKLTLFFYKLLTNQIII